MKTNMINTNSVKTFICAILMLIGISTNAWGTSSSFDVSSITLNNVEWGTSTTSLSKYIGYSNGDIVTSASNNVEFTLTIGDEFADNSLLAFIEDATDGFGITITAYGVNPAESGGYIDYVCNSSEEYYCSLQVGNEIDVELQYTITAPRTSHTAELNFYTYGDGYDLDLVLSIPITINMTGGYTVATAVSPSAKGTVTAKVNGSTRTRVMSNERLDLVATPIDGYQFESWSASDDENCLFNSETASSTYAYLSANQTITAYFDVACTSHTITLSGTPAGTGTNGTFSSDKASACEGATVTLTASPSTGYELNAWTVSKSGGGTCTVTSNQFTMPDVNVTVNATFKAKSYTVTLDREGGTTGAESMTVTYNSSTVTGFTAPTKTGYTFGGYYTGDNGTGTLVLSTGGVLQASVSGYTGAGGIWTKTTTPTTLYAKWTVNSHKLSVASSIANVTVTATPSGESAIAEGSYNAAVDYGTEVTLSASPSGGFAFKNWVVTKDVGGSDVTDDVVAGNTLTMPDYDVTVSATLYAKTKMKTRCLAEPDFTVTGSVYLTSYANVEVFSTSSASNLVTVTCSDFESADRLYITYLNGSGETVAKGSSLFRLCDASTFAYADKSQDYIDISAVDWSEGQTFSIAYKPGASEYNQTDTWTIRLTAKYGSSTDLGYQDITVHGRALPEEFVIATKSGNYWYALPNNLAATQGAQSAITPVLIQVDDNDTPTKAVLAPNTTAYKAATRYTADNKNGLRFTNDGSHWLQVSTTTTTYEMWLSGSGGTNVQDWYLKSSDFGAYEIARDPICRSTDTRRIELYSGSGGQKIGYHGALDGTGNIYLLPIQTKYTPIEATVHEWGEHGVVVAPDLTSLGSLASAQINISGNDPADAVISSVHGASLTAGKFIRLYDEDATIGDISNEGKILYIHWKDGSGDAIGSSEMTIPRIIASSRDMQTVGESTKGFWADKEVHILPGVTLTANVGSYSPKTLTLSSLYVYPGATLKVTTGTLTATTLRLRNGWTHAGDKDYDVARVYIADDAALEKTYASMDYDIYDRGEGTHYYPIAVPFETKVDTIDYVDETLAGASTYGTHYVIKTYDGASRATNGAIDANWVQVGSDKTLKPGVGYIMTGVGLPAYGGCIIRVPLKFDNEWTSDGEKGSATINKEEVTKNSVAVKAYDGPNLDKGWNMLGVPYMACFDASDASPSPSDAFIKGKLNFVTGEYSDATHVYVNVPTHDFSEYLQYSIDDSGTKLLPGWSFFIQVAKDATATFAVAGQESSSSLPIYAPKRTAAEQKVVKTGIVLSNETASDKTTFLISDRYSSEYEIGADLEKMFGNGYTLATYSINNDTRLAFNAMSTAQANELIPIGVRIPADGEYMFSLNERYADADIERLDLIDYETGEVTDLMVSDYIFYATRSQNDERFALNVQRGKQTPTDIGGADIGAPDGARKILLNGTIFIVRDGLLYDATGKRVQTNK